LQGLEKKCKMEGKLGREADGPVSANRLEATDFEIPAEALAA
jgi:hypothetical protein